MATLDRQVRGRGDPFFSLTLSLSNPTTWMDMKHGNGDACRRRFPLGALPCFLLFPSGFFG
uniref:Uncharacterized protein n=1 Tax=Oryza meridionalis TaxID=40149 RepID=A0A0E0C2Q8_9ORYZ